MTKSRSDDCNKPRAAAWLITLQFLLPCGICLAEEGQDKPAARPPLSLASLYDPEQKFEYVTPLPATHWIGEQTPSLLLKRDQRWQRFDAQTGNESQWPVFGRLVERLSQLDGWTESQATAAAIDAVERMKRADDLVWVRHQGSLAIVSASEPAKLLARDAKHWRNITLDPSQRRIAYNLHGDLFVLDVRSGRTVRLTSDGTETLLDGILDWTYQEEIYGRGNYKGFWFSPDGEWLAMLRIDISGIEPYTLASTMSERGVGLVRRYPKAGDPIPQATLLLWDLRQLDQGVLLPPTTLAESTPQQQRIVTGVWWHPDRVDLWFTISDRRQTWRELRRVEPQRISAEPTQQQVLLREESPAWVEPPAEPGWLADGGLVWRSELPAGHNRLYLISRDGVIVTPITPGGLDVQDFWVASDGEFAVVTGNLDGSAAHRYAYRIRWAGGITDQSNSVPQATLEAITTQAGWHSTSLSPDGRQLVDTWSTPSRPPQLSVRSTFGGDGTVIEKSQLKLPGGLTKPKLLRIATEDDFELPAMMIRPKTASAANPCPIVVEVYGGPQAPIVSARWGGNRALYRELLARRGIATLLVDNRSSAGAGVADTWEVRGRLGELEFNDLLQAVKWLKSQPWVDSRRVAIRGWSYGGYMTLYAMTHSSDFVAGIAGGSVTDWREYDAFYTERYMDLPSENPAGYAATSLITLADKLHGRVLMIHGEADDNVHPNGTMRMAGALQRAGKDFGLMIYPGAAHGIRDPQQVWHMARMTDQFLIEELLSASPDGRPE